MVSENLDSIVILTYACIHMFYFKHMCVDNATAELSNNYCFPEIIMLMKCSIIMGNFLAIHSSNGNSTLFYSSVLQCMCSLIAAIFCLESWLVPIAQAIEHWSCKLQVPGSIAGGDWYFFTSHVLASLSSFEFIKLPTLPIY